MYFSFKHQDVYTIQYFSKYGDIILCKDNGYTYNTIDHLVDEDLVETLYYGNFWYFW